MALRTFYFIMTLTIALTDYYIKRYNLSAPSILALALEEFTTSLFDYTVWSSELDTLLMRYEV